MALLNFTGFEAGGTLEFVAVGGTAEVQSTVVRAGAYALRCAPAGTGTGYAAVGGISSTGGDTNFNAIDLYFRVYFRYALRPTAGDEPILIVRNSTLANKLEVRLGSTGVLAAYDTSGALLATGTTVLAQDTWYRIGVRCGTGATAAWEVRLDDTTEVSGTGDLNAGDADRVYLGKVLNRNGNSVDFVYDDFRADDAAIPGAGQCALMRVTGNGTYTAWRDETGTVQGQYTSVDEVPPGTSIGLDDYVLSTLVNTDISTFALESAASAGISGTIGAVKSVMVVARDGAANGLVRLITRSGVTDDTALSSASTAAYANVSRVLGLDPDTGVAWTTAGLDALEVGAKEASTTAKTRVTAVYALVDFVPPAGAGGTATPPSATGTATLLAPAATGGATTAPGAIIGSGTLPGASAAGAATAIATVIAAAWTQPAPGASGGAVATATAVAAAGTLPGATASGSGAGTALPLVLAASATLPGASAAGTATATVTAIAVAGIVPAALAAGSGAPLAADLLEAAWDVCAADATLTAAFGRAATGWLWIGQAPRGTTTPYAVMVDVSAAAEYESPDADGSAPALARRSFQVGVYAPRRVDARRLGGLVAAALRDADPATAEGRAIYLRPADGPGIDQLDDERGPDGEDRWQHTVTFAAIQDLDDTTA